MSSLPANLDDLPRSHSSLRPAEREASRAHGNREHRLFEEPLDYRKLTPVGLDFAFKRALLAKFDASAFALPPAELAEHLDVFSEAVLTPLSLMAFTEQELSAVSTGNFCNFQKKTGPPHGIQHATSRTTTPSASRGQRSGLSRGQADHSQNEGSRPPTQQTRFERDLGDVRRESGRQRQGQEQEKRQTVERNQTKGNKSHKHTNDSESEDEALWNLPIGDSAFGSFDQEGNFCLDSSATRAPAATWNDEAHGLPRQIESTLPNPDYDHPQSVASSSFNLPPPQRPTQTSSSPPAAPLVTPNTRWLYRDPSGNQQGPFSCQQMNEWYHGKYFQDILPLKRETDSFYETLSDWKIKCGGQIPFILSGSIAAPLKIGPTPSNPWTFQPIASHASGMLFGTSMNDSMMPSRFEMLEPPRQPRAPEPTPAGLEWLLGTSPTLPDKPESLAKSTWTMPEAREQARLKSDAIPIPVHAHVPSIEMQPPHQSTTSNYGPTASSVRQNKLDAEGRAFLASLSQKDAKVTEANSESAVPAWNTDGIAKAMNKVSLSDIMQQAGQTEQEKQRSAQHKPLSLPNATFTPVEPPHSLEKPKPAPSWGKVVAQPRSLMEIRKEQESEQSAAKPVGIPTAPRRYADAIRPAEATKAINMLSPSGLPAANMSPTTPSAPTTNVLPPGKSHDSRVQSRAAQPAVEQPLSQWCQQRLAPLSSHLEVPMIVSLLMELRTPAEVIAFVHDNLIASGMPKSVDMREFAAEFIRKRFKTEPPKSQSTAPLAAERPGIPAFETVQRRKK